MLFEERKSYESPIITIEELESETIMSLSNGDVDSDDTFDVDDTPGWLPGWY